MSNLNELLKDDPRYRPNRYIKNKYAAELLEGFECGKYSESKTIGWQPTCTCGKECAIPEKELDDDPTLLDDFEIEPYEPVPCIVLDIFGGSGTTKNVADRLGRRGVMLELKMEYINMAKKRCHQEPSLFKWKL